MRGFTVLFSDGAETAAVTSFEFPWTMIITLALSILLVFIFILLILPRKKRSPAVAALDAVNKFRIAAEAFAVAPSADNLKKVRKTVALADNLLVAAVYKGLVELNAAQVITDETLKICKSLSVSRANESRRAEFAALMIDNALKVSDIVLPFAGKEVDDGMLALTQKGGANAYLDAVKAKHGVPKSAPEDTPELPEDE